MLINFIKQIYKDSVNFMLQNIFLFILRHSFLDISNLVFIYSTVCNDTLLKNHDTSSRQSLKMRGLNINFNQRLQFIIDPSIIELLIVTF